MESWTNEDAIDVLHTLSLAFHMGRLEHRSMNKEERRDFYSLVSDAEHEDFLLVKTKAETLHSLFDPSPDSDGTDRRLLRWGDSVQKARTGEPANWNPDLGKGLARLDLRHQLERLLKVAETDDRLCLEQLVGGMEGIKVLDSSTDEVEHLLTVIESADFLEIAAKYANGPVAGHPRSVCPTGLCRATNQVEYANAFVKCWKTYIARAKEKRSPGTRIEVGFSLPRATMEKVLARYPQAGIEAWAVPPSPLPPHERADERQWSLSVESYEQLVGELSAALLENLEAESKAA
jgi:hypothetical protein